MKCPILHPDGDMGGRAIKAIPKDCLEKECAWWDKPSEGCSMLTIAMELGSVSYYLKELSQEVYVKASIAR